MTPYTIRYTSNGDMSPHYDSLNGMLLTSNTFQFAAVPDLGLLDKRENCYAGQIIRILDGDVYEERIIASYDAGTRTCTMKRPFTTGTGAHAYEVAPSRSQGMVEAVSIACALKLGTWRKSSQAQMGMFTQQYRSAIKTIGDNMANMQMRTGKSWAKDTRDNPNWRP
jgi:hypothetical protein